jgi:hypothetical protein
MARFVKEVGRNYNQFTPEDGPGSGSVSSVALTAPTGFTVTGSPITSSGTLALAFTTGYGIPPLMTGNSGKFLTTNGTTMSWVNIAGTDVTGAALTENDDTNVTMTLGGTPSTALLRSVSMSLGWTGQLAVGRGGTGTSNLTGVVIGNNTSAMTSVTGTALQIFRVNSAGSGYEFFTATFLSNPMTTTGDIIYGGVLGSPTRLGANTTPTNMFLRSVSSGAPSWEPITSADITGAALTRTNDTNVTLTLGGSPSTALLNAASLTLGWSGTLAVGRGGSGASTLTGVLVGNGTSAFTAVVGTAGQFLRRNLANTAYEFRTLQGGDIAGSELTFANDTNVIMTLGGSPASALLQPVSINLGWTGQLAVSRGGTGASTLTGVLIGNGTSAVTAITGTAGQILRRNTGNTAYEFWSANYLVNPMTLEGSIIYATTGGSPAELFANSTSTRKYLSQINGTAPTWEALPASVGGSGTTNYVSKWTSSTTLGNSQIFDNGTGVGVGTAFPNTKLHTTGSLTIDDVLYLQRGSSSLYLPVLNFWNGTGSPLAGTKGDILALGNTGGDALVFVTNSTEKTRLTSEGNFGIGTTTPVSKLEVVGVVAAGNDSATNGSIMLQDRYSGGHLGNVGTMYSGGNLMMGYGVTPSTSSATAFLSSAFVSGVDFGRSSITLGTDVSIYTGAAQSVAIGSSVTMSEKMRLTNAGDLQMITGNIQLNTATNITWGGAYGTDIPTISGTSGSGSNGFLQFYPAGSTSGVKMALRRTGQLALPSYTSSSAFTGTSVATLAVDAAGDVITIAPQQTTASGTYTPTWTGLANVDSVTAFSCQYMRVGDTVTVSGWVTINATADNTPTSLSFSLPINSATTSVNYLNGTGVAQGGGVAACLSGYGTNFGEFEVLPSVDTSVNYSFHFTYRIV